MTSERFPKTVSVQTLMVLWKCCLLWSCGESGVHCHSSKVTVKVSVAQFSVHGVLQARILEWVAISFSKGSDRPRDWTWVSCVAGRFFTVWATREAPRSQGIPRKQSKEHACRQWVLKTWIWLRSPCVWNWPFSQGKGFYYKCIPVCWADFLSSGPLTVTDFFGLPHRKQGKADLGRTHPSWVLKRKQKNQHVHPRPCAYLRYTQNALPHCGGNADQVLAVLSSFPSPPHSCV